MSGLEILGAALVLSTAAGLVHRARSGRLRDSGPSTSGPGTSRPDTSRPDTSGPSTSGPSTSRPRTSRPDSPPVADDSLRGVLADLAARPGERATLLQFSSAFCAPCRATRRILTEVTDLVPGVTHVEVDAEQHLELVRRLDIRKTPTTLVLDAQAREVQRASGQPRKADVLAALGQALP